MFKKSIQVTKRIVTFAGRIPFMAVTAIMAVTLLASSAIATTSNTVGSWSYSVNRNMAENASTKANKYDLLKYLNDKSKSVRQSWDDRTQAARAVREERQRNEHVVQKSEIESVDPART